MQDGDRVTIAMDTGGLIRARHMPCGACASVITLVRGLEERARKGLAGRSDVPLYPGFLQILDGEIPGVCRGVAGAHRLESGAVECVVALYDEDDARAPTLMLVEEQIGEFIKAAQEAMEQCGKDATRGASSTRSSHP